MKLLLATLSLTLAAEGAFAADKTLRLSDEAGRAQVDLVDNQTLEIQLPFHAGAQPRAVISAQGRIYDGECRVLSVENGAPALRVTVQLAGTDGGSGWNGCTATIDPGLGGDSSSLVHVDFGQAILD